MVSDDNSDGQKIYWKLSCVTLVGKSTPKCLIQAEMPRFMKFTEHYLPSPLTQRAKYLIKSFKTSSVSRPKTRGLNFNWGEIITWFQACIVGPLPVLCQSSHCSCLTGNSQDIIMIEEAKVSGLVVSQTKSLPFHHGIMVI